MTISRVSPLDQNGGGWMTAMRFALVAIALAGLAFPIFAAFVGQALFPVQARGSLIVHDGVAVGSSLVAQPFAADKYFQPRPSAASFDPRAMSGSNWAPSNPDLRKRIETSSQIIAAREGVAAGSIPVDLVTASGSGIDPHISPAAARLQVARVAKARGLSVAEVQALVGANTLAPTFGVLGQSRVNVLELNLALDAHTH